MLGRFCLVLHAHIPYVLNHGGWPHGESWLFEAVAECYLPLLDLMDELARRDIPFGITIGLTPVLLEQLGHARFKPAFLEYLAERISHARDDQHEFERKGREDLAALAARWIGFYQRQQQHFEQISGRLALAFATHQRAGRIEILTSAATHAYLPLLLDDASIKAQLRAGQAASFKHLQLPTPGIWLPECAYRPRTSQWQPAVLHGEPRDRPGLETQLAAVGLSHFFIDTHLLSQAKPVAAIEQSGVRTVNDALVFWDYKRGWGNPLDAVTVGDSAQADKSSGVIAMARHPKVSEQVWSSATGYPGADVYLDFHARHGDHGLRYHRVTNHHTPPENKENYNPAAIPGQVREHARHFCSVLRETLSDYTRQTGRTGTVFAPFDAELFGHWWFEGIDFLKNVIEELASTNDMAAVTASTALAGQPPDKIVQLPEGSWGEGGGHQVWLNDQTRWLWEIEYRAESRFHQMLHELPWQTKPAVKQAMCKAARELLLLQSSDWPFAMHSGSAADYGILRFTGHATRFDRLATQATDAAAGRTPSRLALTSAAEADAYDVIFNDLDLNWWD